MAMMLKSKCWWVSWKPDHSSEAGQYFYRH
uniref:Uncharacterized protein n=1 Tax=Anguilla anguilla TaxID=7936 RepID=A0A0E9QAY5_ANGAN